MGIFVSMDLIPAEIQQYAELHTTPESDLLQKIRRDTHLHVLQPRMLSGHHQGLVLQMLCKMISPKRVLEIGTYTGYATISMAQGLSEKSKITTIDINQELENRVRDYFKESGYSDQIEYIIGDAMTIVPDLQENWDLVFIDADKINYSNYFNLVIDKVNSGGYIVADNVLWSGKVVDETKTDEDTKAIRDFNDMIQADSRVENVLFTIRDGLLVIRKND